MLQNRDIESAIARAPDDLSGYRIYGDWLLERGDARGELMLRSADRIEHERAGRNTSELAQLREEEHQLERALIAASTLDLSRRDIALHWELGVIRSVHVDLVSAEPPDHVHAFFAHPLAALVRQLSFGWVAGDRRPLRRGGRARRSERPRLAA